MKRHVNAIHVDHSNDAIANLTIDPIIYLQSYAKTSQLNKLTTIIDFNKPKSKQLLGCINRCGLKFQIDLCFVFQSSAISEEMN